MNSYSVKPEYKTKFTNKTIVYTCIPEDIVCNSKCIGCYIQSSDAFKNKVYRSESQIINDLKNLVSKDYTVIISTTEILLFKNYKDMLKITNTKYVLTNGVIITQKPDILKELKEIGIKQIVLTANFDNSGLELTNKNFFESAIKLIQKYNFEIMLRITLTKNNFSNIKDMVEKCVSLGIKCIQFLRYIPLDKTVDSFSNTKEFFLILKKIRQEYPDIYLSASGSLGFEYRTKKYICTAGKKRFVIGLDNSIYPCIYLSNNENKLGTFVDGELIIDKYLDNNSLNCPAYKYYSNQSVML